jgi:hypothetical protein
MLFTITMDLNSGEEFRVRVLEHNYPDFEYHLHYYCHKVEYFKLKTKINSINSGHFMYKSDYILVKDIKFKIVHLWMVCNHNSGLCKETH